MVLFLSLMGYLPSQPKSFQQPIILISENIDEIEDLKITISGFNYLNKVHNIETLNIPNGCPLNLSGLKYISDYYGIRFHPINKKYQKHEGIDLSGIKGTEVYSTGDGIVDKVYRSRGYGKLVVVDHGHNIKTFYAHLDDFKVVEGQFIAKGGLIGKLGNTGKSTGPHLHYEVRINDKSINPLLLYSDTANLTESNIINIFKIKYDVTNRISHDKDTYAFNGE